MPSGGEDAVKVLPFTLEMLIHRGHREKVKGGAEKRAVNCFVIHSSFFTFTAL